MTTRQYIIRDLKTRETLGLYAVASPREAWLALKADRPEIRYADAVINVSTDGK